MGYPVPSGGCPAPCGFFVGRPRRSLHTKDDEITVSAPFLRALVALSASKSARSQAADTVPHQPAAACKHGMPRSSARRGSPHPFEEKTARRDYPQAQENPRPRESLDGENWTRMNALAGVTHRSKAGYQAGRRKPIPSFRAQGQLASVDGIE